MKHILLACLMTLIWTGCNNSSENKEDSGLANLDQKERQYYSNGKKLYGTYCSNCHTELGVGMGRLIPPLKGSDYLMQDLGRAAQIIKFGQKGPITVNDIEFNQPMPANPKLTNLEIAEIVTYIANAWENKGGGISIEEVENAIKEEEGN